MPASEPIFFDSATQIVMPQWHKGRVALIGDACGCLTLLAGQGSHMAMAGGYVLAQELARQSDHGAAFAAYQAFLKPPVDKKQKDAARFAGLFVPSAAFASLAAAPVHPCCCSAAHSSGSDLSSSAPLAASPAASHCGRFSGKGAEGLFSG